MKINILEKSFGPHVVLQNLRANIDKEGSIALVGLNGSGKSTLLKVISGVCQNYKGDINLESRKIASLIDGWGYYQFFTGEEMLEYLLTPEEMKNSQKYIDIFKVGTYVKDKIRSYSLGMKQRLALVCTFAKESDLLLLDEPINGLDPEGITEFKGIITDLKKEKTIIISTHILTDISSYCDQVFILENHALQNHVFDGEAFRFSFDNAKDSKRFFESLSEEIKKDLEKENVIITIKNDEFKNIIKLIAEQDLKIIAIDKVSNSIDYNLLERMW